MTTVIDTPRETSAGGYDRTPPHNDLAERCVLGGMMLSKDAIGDAVDILPSREEFYRPAHAYVYEAITALYAAGEPADAATVANHLERSGSLTKAGGAPFLHDCISQVPTVANTSYYARIVADQATLRRLSEAAQRAANLAFNAVAAQGMDVPGIVDAAQQALYDVTARRRGNDWSLLGDLLQGAFDDIEAASANGGGRGIPTGFADLDRLLGGGLLPGQLWVFAGRPGMGKSTLGVDVLRHAAIKLGLPSAIFSLEMSKPEIVLRMLSAECRVPLNVLRAGTLSDEDWTKLARRSGEIGEAPAFIDDTPSMNLMEIRAKARRLKQRHDLRLIVVDYLQLMSHGGRSDNRQEEVAQISRGLKLLAKEVECPVIAISQLNRGPETRSDKRPSLADLRESGAIEQDCDGAILLHRDDYYDKECQRAGECDLIVAKHRNGPTDTIAVAAQLHLSRFVDMSMG